MLGNVGVVAEEADILIFLIHHFDIAIHKEIRILTWALWCQRDSKQLIRSCGFYFVTHLVAAILFFRSSVQVKRNSTKNMCSGQLRQIIDKFYSDTTFIDDIGSAGILIFQFIYNMPAISLFIQSLCRYNKQARGVIRLANLPPTNGSAI